MAKKIILALIILILSASLFLMFFVNDNVNVYIDGENVTVRTQSLSQAFSVLSSANKNLLQE